MKFVKRQLMGDDNFVSFEPIEHKYTTKDGRDLISVSQFIKKFTPEFDPDGSILIKKAAKEGITPEALKEIWEKKKNDACDFGTAFHKSAEHYLETGKVLKDNNSDLVKDLKKKVKFEGSIFSEQLLYNLDMGLAGTTDVVEFFDKDNSINLWDFKTNKFKDNKALETYSIFGNKMLPPIKNRYSTAFYKYELQLSLYAWMLEERGYWIKKLILLHIRQGGVEIFPVTYQRDDIKKLFEYYKNGMKPVKKPYSPWITV